MSGLKNPKLDEIERIVQEGWTDAGWSIQSVIERTAAAAYELGWKDCFEAGSVHAEGAESDSA
jgi:hypothetical protein